jgi:uncharacterized membrane protein
MTLKNIHRELMENLNISHIGGELVLIGGVAFYFHRKTNTLQEQITALKEENHELSETMEELKNTIQQLASMVMQIPPQSQPVYPPRTNTAESTTRPSLRRRVSSLNRQPVQQAPLPQPRVVVVKKHRPRDSEDSGDDTYEDGELDAELGDELAKLNNERECTDEQCQLVD